MYTEEMAQAFHAITSPEGFSVELYDNEQWLTVVIDPKSLVEKTEDELSEIVNYINKVKLALEEKGAYVLVTRDAIEE
jgi:uncharacterized protein YqcC (DUF446 family)